MVQLFVRHTLLAIMMVVFLLLSIACQIIIGFIYQNMIKETDNMSSTSNKLLKQCKMKFANCFELNEGVANIPVFVDKFLNRIRIHGLTLPDINHISGQFMLLSVFAAGVGSCRGIIMGEKVIQVLPFYIFSFFGLYLYFSISALVDIRAKRNILKTNLIDYLENHMVNKLTLSIADEKRFKEEEKAVDRLYEKESNIIVPKAFGRAEEEELDELLKEFLV